MSFFRERQIDFDAHNAMVKELYENFRAGHPSRIPVQIEGSIRNYFSNEEINRSHWSFADFFTDARAHIECQLEYQYYQRFHLYCDREMGLPDQWRLSMDFQNSYDQAWFGCPIQYFGKGDVPDTREILRENPRELYSWEDPDPFWGRGDFMKRAWEMFEEIQKRCDAGLEFHRRQVVAPDLFPHVMTDGVFDCAVKLRGAVELMIDMYANPGYLLSFRNEVSGASRLDYDFMHEFDDRYRTMGEFSVTIGRFDLGFVPSGETHITVNVKGDVSDDFTRYTTTPYLSDGTPLIPEELKPMNSETEPPAAEGTAALPEGLEEKVMAYLGRAEIFKNDFDKALDRLLALNV